MDVINLSERVLELRKQKGYSQEELAKKAGLSWRTIQRVEKAKTKPSGETLSRIAYALEVDTIDLIKSMSLEQQPLDTIKGMFEYLHIYKDRILITKKAEPSLQNVMRHSEKNAKNEFIMKTTLIIGLILYLCMVVFFLYLGLIGPSLMAFLFLLGSLFLTFFMYKISFSSMIMRAQIREVKVLLNQEKLVRQFTGKYFIQLIFENYYGKQKKRGFALTKHSYESVQEILKNHNLIQNAELEPDMKNKKRIVDIIIGIIIPFIYPLFLFLGNTNLKNPGDWLKSYLIIVISWYFGYFLISPILLKPLLKKTMDAQRIDKSI